MATRRRSSAKPEAPRIAVAGATGFTGGLVVEQLISAGAEVVAIGRSAMRLAELERRFERVVTHASPTWASDELRGFMQGCGAVISCAGPFLRAGAPVAEAAASAGVSYCDSTGEQPFISWVYENLHDLAREAGIAMVPAFGFDFVPGDLGVAIAARGLEPLRRADIAYFAGTSSASRGTRQSILEILAREEVAQRSRSVHGRTVYSFPGGEEVMLPRHVRVEHVETYMALPLPPLAAAGLHRLLKVGAARNLMSRLGSIGAGVDDTARERRWRCYVEVESESGQRRELWLQGTDVYGFTARALAQLSLRMARGEVDATGACAPAEVVEAEPFLAGLDVSVSA